SYSARFEGHKFKTYGPHSFDALPTNSQRTGAASQLHPIPGEQSRPSGKRRDPGQLAPNNQLVNLCSAVRNSQHPCVTEVTFRREFSGESTCAHDLYCLGRNTLSRFCSEEFRHGSFNSAPPASIHFR